METQDTALLDAPYLSQVQEESGSKVHSNCFLPPIIWPRGEGDADKQEVMRATVLTSPTLNQQKKTEEEDKSLLEELSRIEADLRESLRLETERRHEAEFLRQQENKRLRSNLCYLSLSQRVAKPWVNSYFRRFPMHIYCLPVQAANHRATKGSRTKRK